MPRLRDEEGQAVVELAFALPILLLLILLTVDFGKAFNYWIDQTHLANEAARWAVVGGTPGGPLADAIAAQADSAELKNGTGSVATALAVTFCIPKNSDGTVRPGNVGDPLRATVTSTYRWLPTINTLFGHAKVSSGFGTQSISATATMRLEQPYVAGTSPYSAPPC